jgi:4-hydroxy-L-threonine phosphate dehydrogenase PdxA
VIEKIRMTLMIDLDVLLYFSGHLPLHTHPREISDDRIKRAYDAFRAEMRRPEEEKE